MLVRYPLSRKEHLKWSVAGSKQVASAVEAKRTGGRPHAWPPAKYFETWNLRGSREKKKCFAPAGKRNWEKEGNPTEVIQPCDGRRWGRETTESGNIVVDASLTA